MLLPSVIENVDAGWLSDALTASGALPAGDVVTSMTCEGVGAGIGLLGNLHRVRYRTRAGVQASVVVKLPADNELRGTVDALGLYGREVDFYQRLAGAVPVRTPRVHLAQAARSSTDFVLILEDMGGLVAGDQLAGLTLEQAEAAIDVIAGLHAWAWDDTSRLDSLGPSVPPLRNDTTLALYPGYFAAGWASYLGHMRREPGPQLRAVAAHWAADLPRFLDDLATPTTFCHGDYRADNLFFDADGSVVVIDFQLVHQGCGMSDVAYLVSQSIDHVGAGEHERLVRRYCAALATHGIMYDRGDAWDRYRIAVIFHLVEAVVTTLSWPSLGHRGRQLVLRLVERTEQAIEATGAVSLLP